MIVGVVVAGCPLAATKTAVENSLALGKSQERRVEQLLDTIVVGWLFPGGVQYHLINSEVEFVD